MRTVSAGGGHGPILLGKSEAGGRGGQLRRPRDNSYVNLQGDFIHPAEIFYIGHVKNLRIRSKGAIELKSIVRLRDTKAIYRPRNVRAELFETNAMVSD